MSNHTGAIPIVENDITLPNGIVIHAYLFEGSNTIRAYIVETKDENHPKKVDHSQ